MRIAAVIFDLDGVIVSTDEFHYLGWKRMADEEGIPFDRSMNERLRGVSRMESLEIILEKADRPYTDDEKKELAGRKNNYYRQLLENLSPANILPGVMGLLDGLRQEGVRIAVGSSSRNTPVIIEKIGLFHVFDAIADGNGIVNSKPDPEVFLLAAQKLGVEPARCLVVEDAEAGVIAARAAGMRVVAVGSAANSPQADFSADDLSEVTVSDLADYFIWEPIKG